MRHRSPLMRVELGRIPGGSQVQSAQLLLVGARTLAKDHNAMEKPTMWVAEPCNRPWEEYDVNAYQFARDKFWQAIGGMLFFSSRRRHTILVSDWSSDVCSSD